MSKEEKSLAFLVAERLFGLLSLIIGSLTVYFTLTSINSEDFEQLPIPFFHLFTAIGIALIILGIILIIAKIE